MRSPPSRASAASRNSAEDLHEPPPPLPPGIAVPVARRLRPPPDRRHHDYRRRRVDRLVVGRPATGRSEEHTSELQSPLHLVSRFLLEKKKTAPKASNSV